MHALAGLVNAVKAGRVPVGSYLVVESLDRLSREKIRPALTLLLNLIESGVKVVQLIPAEAVYDEDVEPMQLMMAIMELNRGHSESAVKSERVGAAWGEKKKGAAQKVLTRMTPGWVRVVGGDGKRIKDTAAGEVKFILDPAKAASVRRVFALAREGYGVGRIAQKLNAENVPVLGRTEFRGRALLWSVNVVYSVLTNRATFGEYQPHTGRHRDRKPTGDPVPNYYPPVVTEDEYNAVRGILTGRATKGRGRRGKHINLFAGLLKDARTGGSLTSKHYGDRAPVLIPVESRTTAGQPWASFGLKQFEESVRSELEEVKVSDIAPGDDSGAAVRVESLAGQFEDLKTLAGKWRAKMDNPDIVDEVAAQLAKIETKRKAVAAELATAQQEAANPVSEVWGQARAAGRALAETADDDARERYRSAIRRAIESVWVLIAPCPPNQSARIAAVQVWFKTGAHRDYLIGYIPGHGRVPSKLLKPRSFASAGQVGDLDFRKPDDAAEVEAWLTTVDVPKLVAAIEAKNATPAPVKEGGRKRTG
jgi:DNA invertase Pin-like site-specific DNA recombinase